YTASLLVEFAFGLLLSRALFFRNATLGLLSAAAGLAVLLSWGLDTDTPQWRVLFWGVPAAAIVAGLLAVERAGMFPQNALWPLEKLGDASYSLYLTHGIVLGILGKVLGDHNGLSGVIVALAASIAVAMLCYQFFERPAGQILRSIIARPAPVKADV